MKIIKKVQSVLLVFSLLLAGNFCLVECAFASEGHAHSSQTDESVGHSHGSDQNQEPSDSKKHDAASLCCSSLIAVKNSQGYSGDAELGKHVFFNALPVGQRLPQGATRPGREFDFPPWVSPSQVHLLTHFNHAPPVSF